MALGIVYNFRHLTERKFTVLLTMGGITLVVAVYLLTMMLAEGIKTTLRSSGTPGNYVILRTGAQNEIQSGINREHAAIIATQPEIAITTDNQPLLTNDVVALVSLRKRSDNQSSNVTLRGTSPLALVLRPMVRIIEGRFPSPGTQEVMVGKAIHKKFGGTEIGSKIRLVGTDWPVVGVFDAGNAAFVSEVWGDVDILMPAFRRDRFSSTVVKLRADADPKLFKERIENDRRLSLVVKTEQEFFEEQSYALAQFIRIIGTFVSIIFSLGAIIGALITMYSAVANRSREFGILRAIGFTRGQILRALLGESILLAFIGGVAALALVIPLAQVSIATTNFRTFSELAFQLSISPRIVIQGLLFALIMGALGGLLPAIRASRLKVVDVIRE
jgi:putative ABC transport system permease protein